MIDTLRRVIDKQKVELDVLRKSNSQMSSKIGDANSAKEADQMQWVFCSLSDEHCWTFNNVPDFHLQVCNFIVILLTFCFFLTIFSCILAVSLYLAFFVGNRKT